MSGLRTVLVIGASVGGYAGVTQLISKLPNNCEINQNQFVPVHAGLMYFIKN